MITECSTKTITEIDVDKVKISCVSSENQSGVDTPVLFRADMLDKPMVINRASGLEGELLMTHTDDNDNAVEINAIGEMIISLDNDDADKYDLDNNGNLIYNG